jgi:hypothetical protein
MVELMGLVLIVGKIRTIGFRSIDKTPHFFLLDMIQRIHKFS